MNTTKNAKGRDDEIESVWEEVSSLKECENNCIKSDDCRAVHYDGEMCFKFTHKVKPCKKIGIDFSTKIYQYTDETEYDGKRLKMLMFGHDFYIVIVLNYIQEKFKKDSILFMTFFFEMIENLFCIGVSILTCFSLYI